MLAAEAAAEDYLVDEEEAQQEAQQEATQELIVAACKVFVAEITSPLAALSMADGLVQMVRCLDEENILH